MRVMGLDLGTILAVTAGAAVVLNAVGLLILKSGNRRNLRRRPYEDAEQASILARAHRTTPAIAHAGGGSPS